MSLLDNIRRKLATVSTEIDDVCKQIVDMENAIAFQKARLDRLQEQRAFLREELQEAESKR